MIEQKSFTPGIRMRVIGQYDARNNGHYPRTQTATDGISARISGVRQPQEVSGPDFDKLAGYRPTGRFIANIIGLAVGATWAQPHAREEVENDRTLLSQITQSNLAGWPYQSGEGPLPKVTIDVVHMKGVSEIEALLEGTPVDADWKDAQRIRHREINEMIGRRGQTRKYKDLLPITLGSVKNGLQREIAAIQRGHISDDSLLSARAQTTFLDAVAGALVGDELMKYGMVNPALQEALLFAMGYIPVGFSPSTRGRDYSFVVGNMLAEGNSPQSFIDIK